MAPKQPHLEPLRVTLLKTASGWLVTSLAIVLGLVALLSSTLTFLLVVAGDYAAVRFSFIPFTLGMGIAVYSFSAAYRLLCDQDARSFGWVLPALLSPLGWLFVAGFFGVGYSVH
ncbi:hypothetical protein [Luteolibacter sp. Populi]|uniref:hypothetical protein n=1 Tax=Luteolibacter sp. Populi TaxID=3230487 RepID=UPI0034673229